MPVASWASRHPRRAVWLLSVTVGLAVFFVWIGYARTLDPTNLRWIWHEDPFTHVMGWEQFRNAPLLQYPITKNHLYGLEWSSTVVFTDSIPLAALVLRPFSALLPHPCQYLGWWVLLSLILQAYWAARLVLLRSERLRDAAMGAVFFTTTPVLLERLGLQTGVGSHWLLLWALWLYLSQRGPAHRWWTALLLLTITVHAYLFAMVGPIWVAHLVACRARGELTRRDLALAGTTVLGIAMWMHVLGYFMVGNGAAAGTWRSNFDLIGFIAPSSGALLGLVHSVYNDPWDGSSYLGLGMIALLVASTVAYVIRTRRGGRERAPGDVAWLPLVVVLALLAAFALTNDVAFAKHRVLHLPLPHALDVLYKTFRGAARMIWPTYYVILTATLWLAFRAWPTRARTWVLAAAVGLQLFDLSGVAKLKRAEIRGNGITRPLADPIWPIIAHHYKNLVSVPSKHRQTDWPTFAWFAARNGLGSDIGYLSRSNPAVREAGKRAHIDAVRTGQYAPDTVYYIPSPVLWDVARATMGPRDLAVIADGYHLILPGGRDWSSGASMPSPGVPYLGRWIPFNIADTAGLLLDDWYWTDLWGTWAASKDAELVLPVPPHERVRLTLRWMSARTGRVTIRLDGVAHGAWVPAMVRRDSTFDVTTTSPLLDVHFEVPWMKRGQPTSVGLIAARIERPGAPDPIEPPDSPIVLNRWIATANGAPGRALLRDGWSYGERWGTWSGTTEAELAVPAPAGQPCMISLRWLATAPHGQVQAAHVEIDDSAFDVTFPRGNAPIETTFQVRPQRSWVAIRITIAHPVDAPDGRQLGIGLQAVRVATQGSASSATPASAPQTHRVRADPPAGSDRARQFLP